MLTDTNYNNKILTPPLLIVSIIFPFLLAAIQVIRYIVQSSPPDRPEIIMLDTELTGGRWLDVDQVGESELLLTWSRHSAAGSEHGIAGVQAWDHHTERENISTWSHPRN